MAARRGRAQEAAPGVGTHDGAHDRVWSRAPLSGVRSDCRYCYSEAEPLCDDDDPLLVVALESAPELGAVGPDADASSEAAAPEPSVSAEPVPPDASDPVVVPESVDDAGVSLGASVAGVLPPSVAADGPPVAGVASSDVASDDSETDDSETDDSEAAVSCTESPDVAFSDAPDDEVFDAEAADSEAVSSEALAVVPGPACPALAGVCAALIRGELTTADASTVCDVVGGTGARTPAMRCWMYCSAPSVPGRKILIWPSSKVMLSFGPSRPPLTTG